MMRYYGIDIRSETLGVRRLLVLLRGLPPDAACLRSDSWTLRDEIAAKTLETVDHFSRRIGMALGDKDAGKVQPPMMVDVVARHPPKREVTTDPTLIAAWLGGAMGGKAS